MKQTAVDWLVEKLHNHSGHIDILDVANINNYFEQAKEMEKEQIIDAFWNGDNSDCLSEQNSKEFAEQYYKETYKQK